MNVATRLLLGFTALSVSAFAGTVYLDTSLGNLYAGDPTTGSFSLVGNSSASVLASGSGVGAFSGFEDIDFTSDGTLYGLDGSGNLYKINTSNAVATFVGSTGINTGELVGLAGDSSGNLYAGGIDRIFTINTSTGAATQVVGTSSQPYQVAGDLEFVGSTLYLTSTTTNGGELFSVDPLTGAGTDLGNTGYSSVWGLAYDTDNGVLYGYTIDGREFTVNPGNLASDATLFYPVSGTDVNVVQVPPDEVLGAAFISDTPEPSTLALIGIGLAFAFLAMRSGIRVNRSQQAN